MDYTTEIEKYDKAVYQYLSSISDKIVYAPTSNALRTMTKNEKFSDKKPWNFISFYRDSRFEIDWERMSNYASVTGEFLRLRGASDDDREARYAQNLPINLTYDIELWASKELEVQQLALRLMTKIFMSEQIIQVPINPEGELGRFHILDVSWDDNSDIERETEIGRIYRHTISFTIDSRITLISEVKTNKFTALPCDIYEIE